MEFWFKKFPGVGFFLVFYFLRFSSYFSFYRTTKWIEMKYMCDKHQTVYRCLLWHCIVFTNSLHSSVMKIKHLWHWIIIHYRIRIINHCIDNILCPFKNMDLIIGKSNQKYFCFLIYYLNSYLIYHILFQYTFFSFTWHFFRVNSSHLIWSETM